MKNKKKVNKDIWHLVFYLLQATTRALIKRVNMNKSLWGGSEEGATHRKRNKPRSRHFTHTLSTSKWKHMMNGRVLQTHTQGEQRSERRKEHETLT
jgi:hypothetical protein